MLKPMTEEEKKYYIAKQIEELELVFWDMQIIKIKGISSDNIVLLAEIPDCRKIALYKGKRVLDMYGDPIDEDEMHNFEIVGDVDSNEEDHFHAKYIGK